MRSTAHSNSRVGSTRLRLLPAAIAASLAISIPAPARDSTEWSGDSPASDNWSDNHNWHHDNYLGDGGLKVAGGFCIAVGAGQFKEQTERLLIHQEGPDAARGRALTP